MKDNLSHGRRQSRRHLPPRREPDYINEIHGVPERFATEECGPNYAPIDAKDLPLDIILSRLRGVRGSGPNYSALCPAHDDTQPSLSITERGDGVVLLKCHSTCGCTAAEIMRSLGLDESFLFPTTYALITNEGRKRRRGRTRLDAEDLNSADVAPDRRLVKLLREARTDASRRVKKLADILSLPTAALTALGVGYRDGHWVFPERDHQRQLVGLAYRNQKGEKWSEAGGHRGLTLPRGGFDLQGPVHLSEGQTDTAALHAVGVCAVGRPSAHTSRHVRHWLASLLRPMPERAVIVVGDRDRADDGSRPGRDGARDLAYMLAEDLHRPVQWALPQPSYKDVRDQVVAGDWDLGLVEKGVIG
ncbi:MAG: hypothetical protein U0840_31175 [Gemmataceae bacterium]